MPLCELCERPLQDGACPACGGTERGRLLALAPGVFPATAMPPLGLNGGSASLELRLALLQGELARAESLWDALLRSLRPLGAEGRRQLAECFEACAGLKQTLGKAREAASLRQRAQSLRKKPGDLLHRPVSAQGPGWDSHPWMRAQGDDGFGPPSRSPQAVREDLDRVEAASYRRRVLLGFGTGAFIGLWGAVVTGLSAEFLVPLGLLGGGLWARRA